MITDQNIKQIIIHILQIIKYQHEKEIYVNDLMLASRKKTVSILIESIPEKKQYIKELKDITDPVEFMDKLKTVFPEEQIASAYKLSIEEVFSGFLSAIIPHMTSEERAEFNQYMKSID